MLPSFLEWCCCLSSFLLDGVTVLLSLLLGGTAVLLSLLRVELCSPGASFGWFCFSSSSPVGSLPHPLEWCCLPPPPLGCAAHICLHRVERTLLLKKFSVKKINLTELGSIRASTFKVEFSLKLSSVQLSGLLPPHLPRPVLSVSTLKWVVFEKKKVCKHLHICKYTENTTTTQKEEGEKTSPSHSRREKAAIHPRKTDIHTDLLQREGQRILKHETSSVCRNSRQN